MTIHFHAHPDSSLPADLTTGSRTRDVDGLFAVWLLARDGTEIDAVLVEHDDYEIEDIDTASDSWCDAVSEAMSDADVSDADFAALGNEAEAAGDAAQARIATRAMNGHPTAQAACLAAILAARAMADDEA